jgi:hypothetical protein
MTQTRRVARNSNTPFHIKDTGHMRSGAQVSTTIYLRRRRPVLLIALRPGGDDNPSTHTSRISVSSKLGVAHDLLIVRVLQMSSYCVP